MTVTTTPIHRSTFVPVPPERAFAAFTDEITTWWPLESHTVFADEASSVAFEDGQLVEHTPDGRQAVWGTVTTWEPPSELSFTWHPGRTTDTPTQVTVTFQPEEAGTRVELKHDGWEVFGDQAEERRSGYDDEQGWTMVLSRLQDRVATASALRQP